jgi:hypothetical protein
MIKEYLSDPAVAVVRVSVRRRSFSSDTNDGELRQLDFKIGYKHCSFEELDRYLIEHCRYAEVIVFWMNREALALMSHQDFMTLCDEIKTNHHNIRLGVAADGYDWFDGYWY